MEHKLTKVVNLSKGGEEPIPGEIVVRLVELIRRELQVPIRNISVEPHFGQYPRAETHIYFDVPIGKWNPIHMCIEIAVDESTDQVVTFSVKVVPQDTLFYYNRDATATTKDDPFLLNPGKSGLTKKETLKILIDEFAKKVLPYLKGWINAARQYGQQITQQLTYFVAEVDRKIKSALAWIGTIRYKALDDVLVWERQQPSFSLDLLAGRVYLQFTFPLQYRITRGKTTIHTIDLEIHVSLIAKMHESEPSELEVWVSGHVNHPLRERYANYTSIEDLPSAIFPIADFHKLLPRTLSASFADKIVEPIYELFREEMKEDYEAYEKAYAEYAQSLSAWTPIGAARSIGEALFVLLHSKLNKEYNRTKQSGLLLGAKSFLQSTTQNRTHKFEMWRELYDYLTMKTVFLAHCVVEIERRRGALVINKVTLGVANPMNPDDLTVIWEYSGREVITDIESLQLTLQRVIEGFLNSSSVNYILAQLCSSHGEILGIY